MMDQRCGNEVKMMEGCCEDGRRWKEMEGDGRRWMDDGWMMDG